MTTSKENLTQFAEGNEVRGKYLTRLFDMLNTIAIESDDVETTAFAASAAADIALWDSETEQREIANLIAVANSSLLDPIKRAEAERRIAIMLDLNG